jgi:hypothetical protein
LASSFALTPLTIFADTFHADIEIALDGSALVTETIEFRLDGKTTYLSRIPISFGRKPINTTELLYGEFNEQEITEKITVDSVQNTLLLASKNSPLYAGQQHLVLRYFVEQAVQAGFSSDNLVGTIGHLKQLGSFDRLSIKIRLPRAVSSNEIDVTNVSEDAKAISFNELNDVIISWPKKNINDQQFHMTWPSGIIQVENLAETRHWLRPGRYYLFISTVGIVVIFLLYFYSTKVSTPITRQYTRWAAVGIAISTLSISGYLTAIDPTEFVWLFSGAILLSAMIVSTVDWINRQPWRWARWSLLLIVTGGLCFQLANLVSPWFLLLLIMQLALIRLCFTIKN